VILCVLAVTVYGIGKTFFWPTMLAVVSERFPRGGALTLGTIGGVGMLSAGLLGAPGIGFKQDYYAAQQLKQEAPETYERYAVASSKSFLGVFEARGLDGTKVGLLELGAKKEKLEKEIQELSEKIKETPTNDPKRDELVKKKENAEVAVKDVSIELERTLKAQKESHDPQQQKIVEAWQTTLQPHVEKDIEPIQEATLFGSRMALIWTALVPAMMAVLYLLLLLYFRLKGGYKRLEVSHEAEEKSAAAPWEG
jgi:hypothetical protein